MNNMRQAENDLATVRMLLNAWCRTYHASCRLEVCYNADLDDDNSDGE